MTEHGGKRNGAGRKPSALSVLRKENEITVKWDGQTPADFFREVMQNLSLPSDIRLEAAKAGAPYVHRKQPQAQEIIVPTPLEIEFVVPRICNNEEPPNSDQELE